MRLIALSIVIMAGTIMASVGAIADALPSMRQYSQLPTFGILLAVAASALFAIEWWVGLKRETLMSAKVTARTGSAG